MAVCDGCGEWVSPDYFRVFSDNKGTLSACVSCGASEGYSL